MPGQHPISHDCQDETIEAKTRWFRSLPLETRMDMLCEFTDLILAANPAIQDRKHAEPIAGRIQVLELPAETSDNDT